MGATTRVDRLTSVTPELSQVWYAAYGSNLHSDRFAYYIRGGRAPGGSRTYPGCRDQTPPRSSVPAMIPGRVYFALESKTWTGGMAFYDPDAPGQAAVRAYLISVGQFSDVAAQEMVREPGADLDLTAVLKTGREEFGAGRYETLICPGQINGIPVVTFTAPWHLDDVEFQRPAHRYLRYLAMGLRESHSWDVAQIARYLSNCPGALGTWDADEIEQLLAEDPQAPAVR